MRERHSDFRNSASFSANDECGFVYVLIASWALILFIFASFTVDAGRAWYEQRTIHVATDAAALAGVARLKESNVDELQVKADARRVANANGLSDEEIDSAGGIILGNWTGSSFVASVTPPWNAVQVLARRTMGTALASLVGWRSLRPAVHSTAMITPGKNGVCLVPYALVESFLTDKGPGDVITVSGKQPKERGTWGLLDIGAKSLPGSEVADAIINGVCDEIVEEGDMITPRNGTPSQEKLGFEGRMLLNPHIMFAVTPTFGNGNEAVQITGFRTGIVRSVGGNGNGNPGLTLEIELTDDFGQGGEGGGDEENPLVRLLVE